MSLAPGRGVDYLSRREAVKRVAAMAPREAAVSFEDRGRVAIRASSRYLAESSTSLEDAHAVIKLLQFALSDLIMVAEARQRLLRRYSRPPDSEEQPPSHPAR
ncbi:hypothetical protein [Streptomyces sp. MK37H]|uniref:hypothetical protein n=1 Tax=Streptomyces sp. MK37H TaxID=2699117 RepID=UPI001B365D4A|nr:hypothetical protein [Streptomyces sp. MK37H]MBP8537926.1 hypothetical protein [Streptomyces sp. MK37H]